MSSHMDRFGTTASERASALQTLKTWIDQGQLSAGDALPSERALADRLSVGRRQVRWAVQQLDEAGLIEQVGPRTRLVVGKLDSSDEKSVGVLNGAVVLLAGERLPDPEREKRLVAGWPFHVIFSAMAAVRDSQRHLLKLNSILIPRAELKELMDVGVAGVVVPEFNDKDGSRARMLDAMADTGMPCVIESDAPDDNRFHQVLADHEQGAYELTQLLLSKGRRRILHLDASKPRWWCQARVRGYRRAMAEAGLEPLEPLQVPNWPMDTAEATNRSPEMFDALARYNLGFLADKLIGQQAIDAVMCLSDESVPYVAAAIRLAGLDPASGVVLTGYDNFYSQAWGFKHEPTLPVATVDRNNPAIGRAMVETLLEGHASPIRRLVAPKLVTSFSSSSTLSSAAR